MIIPGIDGSDERHWQSEWERQWGPSAVRTAPASWSEPDLDDWVDAVQEAVDEAARQHDAVVLVAHSLGCWAAATWLAQDPSPMAAAAFLVAPPDPLSPAFPSESAPTFTELAARPLPVPALVVAGTNDPYCAPETSAAFAAQWGARHQLAGAVGHINSGSLLGSWTEGRDLLDSLILTHDPAPAHETAAPAATAPPAG
ncbi:RBBP9/YdeN family alpha/beta hydrolase [Streptomyces sp. NPDC056670]|uniref:RBBP9/YdeN family alpha/beta hydrolase n=1 Tax=Streptomyces sp. NPDC056670 TaxID=3345904 RepID=UPI003684C35B